MVKPSPLRYTGLETPGNAVDSSATVNAPGTWKELPRDAYSAQGAYNNNVTVLPSHDLVVVRLVGDATENKQNQGVSVSDYAALALKACER